MNLSFIAKTAGALFAVLSTLGLLGKLEEINKRLSMLNHNQLVVNGIDPTTGQRSQPTKHQIFDSAVPQ